MTHRTAIPVLLSLLLCLPAIAQNKKQLKSENSALQAKIDSLMKVMDEMNLREAERLAKEEEERKTREAEEAEYTGLSKAQADSIYAHWYMLGKDEELELENVDSVVFESDVPDSVYAKRLQDMNCFIQIAYNDIVRNYIVLYSQTRKKTVSKLLGLSEFYFPLFQETFNRYGLPEELAVMAVIESHLNPQARSRVGALGMWQFMYGTAKGYGLQINSFVDERMDVAKSADAAARYLQKAYRHFGDWNLAISSYNCGSGNVRKAMLRAGGKTGFWDIYPYLPRETRGYVPAFVGMLYAMTYHKEHGISVTPADLPVHVDTFHIHKKLHFEQLRDVVGIPEETVERLNPQYFHKIIPGGDYVLRLPVEYTEAFIANEDSLYRHRQDELFDPLTIKQIKEDATLGGAGATIYKVKKGDTLGGIAKKFGVTVAQIQKWNGMGKKTNLSIGRQLTIYRRR